MKQESVNFEYKVDIFKSELHKILGTSGVAQKFTTDIIKIMTQIWGKDIIININRIRCILLSICGTHIIRIL